VSCRDYIAIGASAAHGTNGLRLDGDLRSCSSGPSDTFQSPPLVPEEEQAQEGATVGRESAESGGTDVDSLSDSADSSLSPESVGVSVSGRKTGSPFTVGDVEVLHVPSSLSRLRRGGSGGRGSDR
jgi:hypothetical protein